LFLKKVKADFKNHYEMSMVGHTMLVEMHLKLQKLKSSPLQPFGGLSIMFLGNFIQLPFISDTLCIQLILNLH